MSARKPGVDSQRETDGQPLPTPRGARRGLGSNRISSVNTDPPQALTDMRFCGIASG
jgi:hypothetical protein